MKWGVEYPQRHDLTSLRLLGSVGEPINPEAWIWYRDNIGGGRCPVVDTWWQTETGAIMISPLPGITTLKPGSATRPLPGITADVVDANGESVPLGSGGYLVLTEPWPSMLRTLWGDDDRFVATYWSEYEGKYLAGDGSRRDEDGDYWLLGRIDDVMNVSGHRLSTIEIESALVDHPKVAEAAVVGRTDETTGQAIAAFVTLKGGVVGDEDLIAELRQHVATRIGGIARPKSIVLTDDLPKTRSGKIMRRLLRDISENRHLGDVTTLANEDVVADIADQAEAARAANKEEELRLQAGGRGGRRPVGRPQQRARQDEVGRRPVAGDRHVVDDRDPQERLHVHVVGLRLERVPEEDHDVEPPLRHAGADLLVAAHRTAQEPVDVQAELGGDQAAGGAGAVELVPRERAAVEARPVQEVELAVVVRDQRDALAMLHAGTVARSARRNTRPPGLFQPLVGVRQGEGERVARGGPPVGVAEPGHEALHPEGQREPVRLPVDRERDEEGEGGDLREGAALLRTLPHDRDRPADRFVQSDLDPRAALALPRHHPQVAGRAEPPQVGQVGRQRPGRCGGEAAGQGHQRLTEGGPAGVRAGAGGQGRQADPEPEPVGRLVLRPTARRGIQPHRRAERAVDRDLGRGDGRASEERRAGLRVMSLS
jgi:hypothetical protein